MMQYDYYAPLKLTAMTLRGIGSYIDGARLEVRPLTVLCGANGSGKSTWLRTLEMLWRSRKTLPYKLRADRNLYDGDLNAYVIDELSEDLWLDDPGVVTEFGPFGCVGLEFLTTKPIDLPKLPAHKSRKTGRQARQKPSVSDPFLVDGSVPKGTKIRIRLADIGRGWEGVSCQSFIEVTVGTTTLQFWLPSDSRDHQLWTNLGAANQGKLSKIGEVNLDGGSVNACSGCGSWDSLVVRQIAQTAIAQIKDLLNTFLHGVFYLSDVRVAHTYRSISDVICREGDHNSVEIAQLGVSQSPPNDLDVDNSRYIGPHGEATFVVERLFAYSEMRSPHESPQTAPPLVTEAYVSFWLNELTGVKVKLKGAGSAGAPSQQLSLSDKWTEARSETAGLLVYDRPVIHEHFGSGIAQYFPVWGIAQNGPDEKWDQDPRDLCRFSNPCFQSFERPPARFSAGFHQIAPIVVQSAVMLGNEVLAIENPEVHLHPKLQLDVAEFLMKQSCAGRTILVETHSDLFVRRVIREVLEESIQLGQESIRIYFTDAELEKEGYHYSTLKLLSVNEAGRIDNWPDGFLADDAAESQRLLDVMYGSGVEADEDEELSDGA